MIFLSLICSFIYQCKRKIVIKTYLLKHIYILKENRIIFAEV